MELPLTGGALYRPARNASLLWSLEKSRPVGEELDAARYLVVRDGDHEKLPTVLGDVPEATALAELGGEFEVGESLADHESEGSADIFGESGPNPQPAETCGALGRMEKPQGIELSQALRSPDSKPSLKNELSKAKSIPGVAEPKVTEMGSPTVGSQLESGQRISSKSSST